MEFAIKTLVVFAIVIIALMVFLMIYNSMTGQSSNVIDGAYNFLKGIIGVK
jgi:hypothetical protein